MKQTIAQGWMVRNFMPDDVAALAKYANNYNIWKNLTDQFPNPYTLEDAQHWIETVRSQPLETHFAIANDTELVGGIGFDIKQGIHCQAASLGYWLGEPFWGQGIVTEALRAVTAHAFAQHDLVRLYAGVFETNPASMRVLEKAGYLREGCLRKYAFKDHRLLDIMIYAILKPGV